VHPQASSNLGWGVQKSIWVPVSKNNKGAAKIVYSVQSVIPPSSSRMAQPSPPQTPSLFFVFCKRESGNLLPRLLMHHRSLAHSWLNLLQIRLQDRAEEFCAMIANPTTPEAGAPNP
jgi:hypothetical protein